MSQDPLIGRTLRNRYKITELLGRGGFGNTYKAVDLDLPRQPKCVVKHLKPKNPNPAVKLVLLVYQNTASFPSDEKFGLVVQMRLGAVSVPANIAEGFKRRGMADKARFYNIAQASKRGTALLLHSLRGRKES